MESIEHLSFKFGHGLGDCANFACAIPLWINRGFRVQVQCPPDKAPLFQAAGAEIVDKAEQDHRYLHAPRANPDLNAPWLMNKCGHNLTQPPMPNIGSVADLWPELVGTRLSLKKHLERKSKAEIDGWLRGIDGPLVLLHTRGNSSPQSKSVPQLEADLYRELIDRTDATVLALDWDDRVEKIGHSRFHHLERDWRKLSVPELAYLIERAALLVGVDSGPLHLTRFTDTPALGLWTHHTPSHFALPRDRTAHLCTSGHAPWTRTRRHDFHVIDAGEQLTAAFVAKQAVKMMELRSGRELVLADLLERCSVSSAHTARDNTFALVLDHLRGKQNPQVIETGCVRSEDDFTAGFSTYLFGLFLDTHGAGRLDSVDIAPANVDFARKWTAPFKPYVEVHQGDSVKFLGEWSGPKASVVYLDSLDVGQPGYAEHCLNEARAAEKLLEPGGLLLVDDTFRQGQTWAGKGLVAVPYLLDNGFALVHSGYQTLLKKAAK